MEFPLLYILDYWTHPTNNILNLIRSRDFWRCTFVKKQPFCVWNIIFFTSKPKCSNLLYHYNYTRVANIYNVIYIYFSVNFLEMPTSSLNSGHSILVTRYSPIGLAQSLVHRLGPMRSSVAESMQHSSGWTRPVRSRRPRRRRPVRH